MSRYCFRRFRYLCVPTTYTYSYTVILFSIEQSNLRATLRHLFNLFSRCFQSGIFFFNFLSSLVITQPYSLRRLLMTYSKSLQFSLTENFQTPSTVYRDRLCGTGFSRNYFRDCVRSPIAATARQMQPKGDEGVTEEGRCAEKGVTNATR